MFSVITNIYNKKTKGAVIFTLLTLASPSGRNVNCDKKQLTEKTIFRVVSSICTNFVNTCPTVFYNKFL
jgi:hypothetical protein